MDLILFLFVQKKEKTMKNLILLFSAIFLAFLGPTL